MYIHTHIGRLLSLLCILMFSISTVMFLVCLPFFGWPDFQLCCFDSKSLIESRLHSSHPLACEHPPFCNS